MTHACWPLWDLVIRTPRLELRPVREADAMELIELAGRGIHEPDTMPFLHPFTDLPSPERERTSLQFYLGNWANWSVEEWRLAFIVRRDGRCVGTQDLSALRFPVCRSVNSGSWVGRADQGQGVGSEMRAAVLEFVFGTLGARRAETEAFEDNAASLRITERLGYQPNGWAWESRRNQPAKVLRYALDAERWQTPVQIEIDGATTEVLEQFGC